jgi:hypothetical protein
MTHGLAPCEKLLEQHDLVDERLDRSWEVGRLVLDPRYRAGPELLRRCLFLTMVHTLENYELENLFASCSPVLGRLYRRFGFKVLVKEACQDAEGSYSLIHGTVPDVLRALAGNEAERQLAEEIMLEREGAVGMLQ